MEITGELKVIMAQFKDKFKKEVPLEELPKDMTSTDVMEIIYRSFNENYDLFDMYKERNVQ